MHVIQAAKFARSGIERQSSLELGDAPIVWDKEEFFEALKAWDKAMAMTAQERERWAGKHPELDIEDPADTSEFMLAYLALWFHERYEAHCEAVRLRHHERFRAIQRLLDEERTRLEAERLCWREGTRLKFNETFLLALLSIRYEAVEKSVPQLQLDNALAIRARLENGSQVKFFKRTPYAGYVVYDEEEEAFFHSIDSGEDFVLPPTDFAVLLSARHALETIPIEPIREARQRIADLVPGAELPGPAAVLVEQGLKAEDAALELECLTEVALRTEVAYRFIRKHYEILEHRGLISRFHTFDIGLLDALDGTSCGCAAPPTRIRANGSPKSPQSSTARRPRPSGRSPRWSACSTRRSLKGATHGRQRTSGRVRLERAA